MSSIFDCTLSTCSITESIFDYRPSLVANSIFLAVFAITGITHTVQGILTKKPYFMIAMQLGCITECIGYVGRIIAWNNPFGLSGFLINICCLALAPAFYAGALYFTLGDVVRNVSVSASRFKPNTYAIIFITCDCVSLTLQGTGGGLASASSEDNGSVTGPTDVMVAGLAFQVFTMTCFVIMCLDYAWRARKQLRSTNRPLRLQCSNRTFWLFVSFASLALLTIYIRTVYRVIELAGGWTSKLYQTQAYFIVLEGVMIVIAVISLHIGHPGNISKGKVYADTVDVTPSKIEHGSVHEVKEKKSFAQRLRLVQKEDSDTTLATRSSLGLAEKVV